jgi:hypothetical protein
MLASGLGTLDICSTPLSPDAMKLPSSRNEPPRRATPRSFRLASRLTVQGEDRVLLSDFCNRLTSRAPVDRPIPEREAFAVADR